MSKADEVQRAEREYDQALDAIRKAQAGKGAGLEIRLGSAYQRLVRLNARPQLKLKYRG